MYSYFLAQTANTTNAAAAGAAQQGSAPFWTSVVPFIPIVIAFYFLFIRPQSVAQKKQLETVKSAKTGDKIVTTGGIHGVISNVKDTTVIVKVGDNMKLEIEKSHIDKVVRAVAEVP